MTEKSERNQKWDAIYQIPRWRNLELPLLAAENLLDQPNSLLHLLLDLPLELLHLLGDGVDHDILGLLTAGYNLRRRP